MAGESPPDDNSVSTPSPFHAGEIAVQQCCGVQEKIDQVGRIVIRDAMPLQHRQFFAQLPLIFVGSLDDRGRPWASVLVGAPGFVRVRSRKDGCIPGRCRSCGPSPPSRPSSRIRATGLSPCPEPLPKRAAGGFVFDYRVPERYTGHDA